MGFHLQRGSGMGWRWLGWPSAWLDRPAARHEIILVSQPRGGRRSLPLAVGLSGLGPAFSSRSARVASDRRFCWTRISSQQFGHRLRAVPRLILMGDHYLSFPLTAVRCLAGNLQTADGGRRPDRSVAFGVAAGQLLRANASGRSAGGRCIMSVLLGSGLSLFIQFSSAASRASHG